jgi:hypothetical protein
VRVKQGEERKNHYERFLGPATLTTLRRRVKAKRRFLGESEATKKEQSKGNAALLARSYKIYLFGWDSSLEVQNQPTSGEGTSN